MLFSQQSQNQLLIRAYFAHKNEKEWKRKGDAASVTIQGNELLSGMYVYSLTCDG